MIILGAVGRFAHRVEGYGLTAGISKHQVIEGGGIVQLSVHPRSEGLRAGIEGTTGKVHIRIADRSLNRLQTQSARRERVGIEIDAHGIGLGTIDLHIGNPRNTRQRSGHLGLRILVESVEGHIRRGHANVEDWLR